MRLPDWAPAFRNERGQTGSFPHSEQLPSSLRRSVLPIAVQPSISIIHCKSIYSLANPVLPFPMFCSPNNFPTPSCPRALRSDGCHPEQTEGSAFLLFLRLAPLPSSTPNLGRSLVYPEPRRAANPFIIRTSGKCAPNPFRIRTYKTQDLKPFRIRTYKKTGVGGTHFKHETHSPPSHPLQAAPCGGSIKNQTSKSQNGGDCA
jgi:hypothetical protein